jgi:hypothetical protein
MAAAEAAGRYGHVLFPSGTHAPALELAEKLLDTVGKGLGGEGLLLGQRQHGDGSRLEDGAEVERKTVWLGGCRWGERGGYRVEGGISR